MTWRSVRPSCVLGEQAEEALDLGRHEPLGAGELPQDRPELRSHFRQPALEEARDRLGAGGQVLAVDAIAARLDREHEAVRRLVRPLAEGGRCLRPIERAVDLDRAELPAGVVQLLGLGQALREEALAPGLVDPTLRRHNGSSRTPSSACHPTEQRGIEDRTQHAVICVMHES